MDATRTSDIYTVSEAKTQMYQQGYKLGKKDSTAERPEWQEGDRLAAQAEFMADTLVKHWGVPAARKGEMATAFLNGYNDGWRGKRTRGGDARTRDSWDPSDDDDDDEQESWGVYCQVSGGVTGSRGGMLKSNGQEVRFPTKEAAEREAARLRNEMGRNSSATFHYSVQPTGDAARTRDAAGRRARLHRALDCVMDRTGYGRDMRNAFQKINVGDVIIYSRGGVKERATITSKGRNGFLEAKTDDGREIMILGEDVDAIVGKNAYDAEGAEHNGAVLISGRWWPKDSKVAQAYLARTKAQDADGDTVQCENCNQQVPEDQAVHTRAYGWICKECKEKVRSGFGKDAGNFQEGDRVKVLYGSASGKNGVISQVSPSGGFYGVASQAGKHLGYFSESDLKLLRRGGE